MPKISFVVAIYNVDKYLDACICSLVNQTYDDFEIILVNDGSTDDSRNICEKYCEKYGNVKLINQENQGANVARNNGLDETSGEWVIFVDGDDFVELDLCIELSGYLQRKYDVVMFSNYSVYDEKKIQHIHSDEMWEISSEEDIIELKCATLNRIGKYKYNLDVIDPVTIWNKAYNTAFLKNNGLRFVPGFPKLQDISFNLLVYEKAKNMLFIDYPGYCYREATDNSVTRRYQEDIEKKFEIINEWFYQYARSQKEEKIIQAYYQRIVTHLRTCIVLKYCNPCYEKKYFVRRKEFFELLDNDIYRDAMDQCNLSCFPWKERLLSLCIKKKLFFACESMNWARRILGK